ncbi:hypothetical protein KEM48_010062 [Puccinia striiformis f. sp. tritici PST-130]|uniref:Uncharacterized protein n=1 Tax=Puccinia striiformis f. sp. tritici PST-78 TaxID=1165861 RepID=A0A0L0UV41_9BASI|nr:hypothetical protein KEM48_010062 [Puccinia striiformis f. sp. tritici PST-130]KNE90898.1 hypothetical protein PSTG_15688 [Puccinia striiformis f. sp. tritici PST-78]
MSSRYTQRLPLHQYVSPFFLPCLSPLPHVSTAPFSSTLRHAHTPLARPVATATPVSSFHSDAPSTSPQPHHLFDQLQQQSLPSLNISLPPRFGVYWRGDALREQIKYLLSTEVAEKYNFERLKHRELFIDSASLSESFP